MTDEPANTDRERVESLRYITALEATLLALGYIDGQERVTA